jgi:hypothetical protein
MMKIDDRCLNLFDGIQHLRAAEQLRCNITGKIPIIPDFNESTMNEMLFYQQCICWQKYYELQSEEECSGHEELPKPS